MMRFLDDDNGNRSSMRLMCVIALAAAVLFSFIAVLSESAIAFDLAKLFFAPKAVQKWAEK